MKRLLYILVAMPMMICASGQDVKQALENYKKEYEKFSFQVREFITSQTVSGDRWQEARKDMSFKFLDDCDRQTNDMLEAAAQDTTTDPQIIMRDVKQGMDSLQKGIAKVLRMSPSDK